MKKNIRLRLKDLDVKEVLQKEVLEFGSGAHVIVPKRHLNKEVIVIVKDN